METKFEIYLKAIGAAKKPDEMKVGLLLNHIGEPCLEIYSNLIFLPERDDPAGGEDKLPAENPDNYATIMAKFDEYFKKRDPQLMLREKFWIHLKREPTQTLDSWIVTVKERAAECKFPVDFYEQAVKDKLTFSCKEDTYKLKLYDEGKRNPLRDLLKKESAWLWGPAQQEAFQQLKADMASEQVLARYDPEKETMVSSDASSFGLGAVLMQKQPSGEMRPVAYVSRSMTETERRYAQIDKEALAITWALEHWAEFLIGMRFKVETDHKPLIQLLSTKLIDELPVRIQRFRMRLMRFDFPIAHVPGKLMYTADSLSRSPQECKAQESKSWNDLHDEVEAYVNAVLVTLPASVQRLDEIRSELKNDDTLKTAMQYVQNGWPEEKRRVHGPIAKYWSERGDISFHDRLLLRGRRIIIPPRLGADVLRRLHDGHQGITKLRANAASLVLWPGISQDITKVVQNCATCEKYRRERIEPMKGTEFPDRPWSRVGVDFFQHKDKHYLLAVDYFSRDVEICLVSKDMNSSQTILQLKRIFSRHGIPDILFTDNGPQFDSREFTNFSTDWQFQHLTSSPRFPQSNGEVERSVQTMKMVLNKSSDEYLAFLNYRDTPLHHGYSPAQLIMGRKLRTRIPCHPNELKPETPDYDHIRGKEREY